MGHRHQLAWSSNWPGWHWGWSSTDPGRSQDGCHRPGWSNTGQGSARVPHRWHCQSHTQHTGGSSQGRRRCHLHQPAQTDCSRTHRTVRIKIPQRRGSCSSLSSSWSSWTSSTACSIHFSKTSTWMPSPQSARPRRPLGTGACPLCTLRSCSSIQH